MVTDADGIRSKLSGNVSWAWYLVCIQARIYTELLNRSETIISKTVTLWAIYSSIEMVMNANRHTKPKNTAVNGVLIGPLWTCFSMVAPLSICPKKTAIMRQNSCLQWPTANTEKYVKQFSRYVLHVRQTNAVDFHNSVQNLTFCHIMLLSELLPVVQLLSFVNSYSVWFNGANITSWSSFLSAAVFLCSYTRGNTESYGFNANTIDQTVTGLGREWGFKDRCLSHQAQLDRELGPQLLQVLW